MRRVHLAFVALATTILSLTAAPGRALGQDLPQAPPPMDPGTPGAPAPEATSEAAQKEELDRAEREDSGRTFELFWLDAAVGGSYINMKQFSEQDLGLKTTSSGGPAFSVGAGLRFVVLVLGARARYNALSDFNMWQLNGELGLKFPIRSIDFLMGLHGGYSFVGRLGDTSSAANTNTPTEADAVKIRGFNAGLDIALDYYVSPTFSIGFGGIADALILNRPPAALPDLSALPPDQRAAAEAQIQSDPLYQKSGTTFGIQLGGFLRMGLHFGL